MQSYAWNMCLMNVCVELKSLKLYVWAFRDEGAFHEAVTNEILGDLGEDVKTLDLCELLLNLMYVVGFILRL